MRLHPRTQHVSGAAATIRSALLDLQGELGLTDTEMLRVLLDVAHSTSKYLLRAERHPGNPDRKADEACGDSCRHDDVRYPDVDEDEDDHDDEDDEDDLLVVGADEV